MRNPPSYGRIARMKNPELIRQLDLPQLPGVRTLILAEIKFRLVEGIFEKAEKRP